jgi:hypothetical protein
MRIRIEVEDKGLKSVYEFESQGLEGEALRDRIVGYLTAAGIFSQKEEVPKESQPYDDGGTLMDRLEKFIRFEFPDTWFTSQELREKFETVIDDIKLSTVSTYLSRMNQERLLERRGNRNNREYRLVQEGEAGIASGEAYAAKRKGTAGRW